MGFACDLVGGGDAEHREFGVEGGDGAVRVDDKWR
jgi:hypothetical protein